VELGFNAGNQLIAPTLEIVLSVKQGAALLIAFRF
jgi:hypothetical protein